MGLLGTKDPWGQGREAGTGAASDDDGIPLALPRRMRRHKRKEKWEPEEDRALLLAYAK